MKKYLQNWKTTSAGLVAIVGAVALYVSDKTKFVEAFAMALGGVGLILAGDAKPTEPTEPTA